MFPSPSVTTHTTLLARLADGQDQPAWREFCDRYGDLIRGYSRRIGVRPNDTEDVLQDTLIELTKSLPKFEYDPAQGKFRNYLRTIVRRAAYRRFRQNSSGPPQSSLEDVADPASGEEDAVWEDEWRQHHLRCAMKTIDVEFNEADRTAFRLYVVAQREAAETARELGLSIDQVYQAKSRIVKRLTQLVEQQIGEEG